MNEKKTPAQNCKDHIALPPGTPDYVWDMAFENCDKQHKTLHDIKGLPADELVVIGGKPSYPSFYPVMLILYGG